MNFHVTRVEVVDSLTLSLDNTNTQRPSLQGKMRLWLDGVAYDLDLLKFLYFAARCYRIRLEGP